MGSDSEEDQQDQRNPLDPGDLASQIAVRRPALIPTPHPIDQTGPEDSESPQSRVEEESMSGLDTGDLLKDALPYHVKHEVQSNITDVDKANQSEGFKSTNIINMQLKEVKLFNSIMPNQMAEYQKKDPQLSLVYDKVSTNIKPKLSEIHHIRSRPICRLLLQYDQLSLIWGVLHCCTFKDDNELQQLILPQQLREQTLKCLHDDNGHQGLQRVLDIL